MPGALTEHLRLPAPEEPWWWPLGPTGFVIGMFAGITYMSSMWPIRDDALADLRATMMGVLVVLVLAWFGLAAFLRARRAARLTQTFPVRIDDAGVAIGERGIPWAQISRCEWSPFGGLLEIEGEREHIAAVVEDAQAGRLQAATDARLSR